MLKLNLPDFDIKIKRKENLIYIWDCLRRKYVVLTPEEWVRQHFVNYLLKDKEYPQGLMANEKQIVLNTTRKRCDSVVYNKFLEPVMIIEYKSPDIKITQNVFDQIIRYNIVLKVDYLVVSNGMNHYCCKMNYSSMSYNYLPQIPLYKDL